MFGNGFFGFGGNNFEEESQGQEQAGQQEQKEVDNKKFYEILGVDQKTDINEIKKAYKKACIKGEYRHPDKGGDPEKFKLLNEAYDVLSNPEKRDVYDKYGTEGLKTGGGGGGDPFDIFSQLFGGSGRQKPKGPVKAKPRLIELEVSLEDVYVGKMEKIKFNRKRTCEACDGKGGSGVQVCTTCKGKKMITRLVQLGPGMFSQSTAACTTCKGQGEICPEKDRCKTCQGRKIVDQQKEAEVTLEKGVPNDYDYILTAEGDEGPGILAGDIYVRIKIQQNDKFQRKGADLIMKKKISLVEALGGLQFEFTHLDDSKIIIATKPDEVISPNEIKQIKGKGMPFFKNSMDSGNLYIQFEIEFPKKGYLKQDQINVLKKVLPPPQKMEEEKEGSKKQQDKKKKQSQQQQQQQQQQAFLLEEYDESDLNPNPEGGKQKEEDEDDYKGHRQGGVQCQQQ